MTSALTRSALVISITTLLAACGGGESSSPAQPQQPPKAFNFTKLEVAPVAPYSVTFEWEAAEGATEYTLCATEPLRDAIECHELGRTQIQTLTLSPTQARLIQNQDYYIRASNVAGTTISNTLTLPKEKSASLMTELTAPEAAKEGNFAHAIDFSLDGKVYVIGAPKEKLPEDHWMAADAGAVYLYQQDDVGGWLEPVHITPEVRDGFDYFGSTVSLSADGKVLAVGAYGESSDKVDDPNLNNVDATGAAYIFEQQRDGSWLQTAFIKSETSLETFDKFGYDVAISGNGRVLAVTAFGHDASDPASPEDNDTKDSGSVYVFEKQANGNWLEADFIKAPIPEVEVGFGHSIVLDREGLVMIISEPHSGGRNNYGDVFRYERKQGQKFVSFGRFAGSGLAGGSFGWQIDMSQGGNVVAIAEPNVLAKKRVYVHRKIDGAWVAPIFVEPEGEELLGDFGKYGLSLSADGEWLAVADAESPIRDQDGNVMQRNVGEVFLYNIALDSKNYFKPQTPKDDLYYGRSVRLNGDGTSMIVGTKDNKALKF